MGRNDTSNEDTDLSSECNTGITYRSDANFGINLGSSLRAGIVGDGMENLCGDDIACFIRVTKRNEEVAKNTIVVTIMDVSRMRFGGRCFG
mmetsp:Transcript_9008/g.13066  ORF Transcript_9008/g.13066 Transcript_9008/m.13066 type:complete len:91 (-) Transcript_9008:203-475(-)